MAPSSPLLLPMLLLAAAAASGTSEVPPPAAGGPLRLSEGGYEGLVVSLSPSLPQEQCNSLAQGLKVGSGAVGC